MNKLANRCFFRLTTPRNSSVERQYIPGLAAIRRRALFPLPDIARGPLNSTFIRPVATSSFIPLQVRKLILSTTIPTGFRNATNVERISDWLLNKNHTTWGFVIYRCTYADDEAWESLTSVLKAMANHNLVQYEGGRALAEKIIWTIHDDQEALDGATIDQVRELFNAWVGSDAAKVEQPGHVSRGVTTRYGFPIYIDAAALESCKDLEGPDPDIELDAGKYPYVNIVDAGWEPDSDLEEALEDPHDISVDVGYMMVAVYGLIPSMYEYLHERDGYYAVYQRPPLKVLP